MTSVLIHVVRNSPDIARLNELGRRLEAHSLVDVVEAIAARLFRGRYVFMETHEGTPRIDPFVMGTIERLIDAVDAADDAQTMRSAALDVLASVHADQGQVQ